MFEQRAPGYIANFDSASAMLRATSRALQGRDFPPMGTARFQKPFMKGANLLSRQMKEQIYALSGAAEGMSARNVDRVSSERISRWAVSQYPERPYPAVMIGSSNGAAVHLCAALGIPWLPQTTLVPVRRRRIPPDETQDEMAWAREPADRLLDANPDIRIHHMHDPNQDRLMIRYMTYFRIKRTTLGESYERFLSERLQPGGTIFLLECGQKWPAKRVSDRHLFQVGGVGGLEPTEYHEGSDRVEEFLSRYGSHRRRWKPPEPDGEFPEAEWGFEPAMGEDVRRFARENDLRVRRIRFDEPEDLSPLVADLYRWRYRRRRMMANRLVVDSFILMDPMWTLRTGSTPWWSKFPVEPSAESLETYLDAADPFEEIHVMLFSHGTDSAGLAGPERWQKILDRARKKGSFLGVAPEQFPRDFGALARYHDAIRGLPARYPLPGPLSLEEFEEFLQDSGDRYAVRWEDG
ncbi:MAG: hypothetical protein EA350_08750 [Gemmatimonadales bacterium]|nr:MAG: hypothetical protein EA350_08750 [Gemmatimonadales bacterium]